MVMSMAGGMGDAALREWLPRLWRRIEDAHYSYLETDDSPEKLQQKKKLEDYIMEYLSRAPHECKFRLAETSKVFNRTVQELPDFNAYRAGLGWAAIARYAAHLLTQPWRKEYKLIRLYSGFYKHEVEANMVGAETLLHAMGYTARGCGRLALLAPPCPDTVAAVSRDALVAHTECQIMLQVWEALWSSGANVSHITWADIVRERSARPARAAATAAALLARSHELPYMANGSEIYSNIPTTVTENCNRIQPESRYSQCHCPNEPIEEPAPIIHPQYMPANLVPPYMYPVHPDMGQCSTVPMVTSYVPYYYPVQTPYMIPTPVYPSIKHATTIPVNGYPPYRYPSVPTGQLIELESSSVYENEDIRHKKRPESSRRNSTSKSGFSDVTLPSLPRSDTQPTLSKAREDGMGTYESWDYVFRNLSSKDEDGRSGYSPSIDRDSRTLDRFDKAHRSRYQPTTLDLEDGLQALSLDHRVEELKKDLKKPKPVTKRISIEEKRPKRQIEPIPNPKADALITTKVAPDKVKLLTKKDIKDRKEVIKQQNSVNGVLNTADVKKVRKPTKLVAVEVEKPRRPVENGTQNAHSSKTNSVSSAQPNYDLKAQLIVSLDETDSRKSPPRNSQQNGDRPVSRNSSHERTDRRDKSDHKKDKSDVRKDKSDVRKDKSDIKKDKWTCGTCTYLNKDTVAACEMCGKSKRGPEIQPLTSGGRECPACTLVNQREARVCDACGTSLEHCPTYI